MKKLLILFIVLIESFLLSSAVAQSPTDAASTPAQFQVYAKVIYKMVLAGAYQMAFGFPKTKAKEELNGLAREGFLLTPDTTMPLVPAGEPCQEPTTPDPNYQAKNTADYWMHKFSDWHIPQPAGHDQEYQKLMVEYRKLCHTNWDLATLLANEKPNLLISVKAKADAEKRNLDESQYQARAKGSAVVLPHPPAIPP